MKHKIEPYKLHTKNRYKLSVWNGEKWMVSYHYTVPEAQTELSKFKTPEHACQDPNFDGVSGCYTACNNMNCEICNKWIYDN